MDSKKEKEEEEEKEEKENIFGLKKLIIEVKGAQKASSVFGSKSSGTMLPEELPDNITPPEYDVHRKQYERKKKYKK